MAPPVTGTPVDTGGIVDWLLLAEVVDKNLLLDTDLLLDTKVIDAEAIELMILELIVELIELEEVELTGFDKIGDDEVTDFADVLELNDEEALTAVPTTVNVGE